MGRIDWFNQDIGYFHFYQMALLCFFCRIQLPLPINGDHPIIFKSSWIQRETSESNPICYFIVCWFLSLYVYSHLILSLPFKIFLLLPLSKYLFITLKWRVDYWKQIIFKFIHNGNDNISARTERREWDRNWRNT